ncbi:MAG: hypothetical protein KAS25_01280, partial [Dehalococcoidales bacterium]|nr:hypothetical protein [Dehalococcoidales bacterium]
MRYAEVSVNSPAAQRRTFSYAIPPGLDVRGGQAVLVPFGERILQGIVLELAAVPVVEDTRDILDVIESEPILTPSHISLARWISDYYLSPLFDAVALMLPPGFERKAITFVSLAHPDIDISSLNDDQRKAIDLLSGQGRVELKKLEKALGKKKASAVASQLVRQGLLTRSYELGPVRIRPKTELYIRLSDDNLDTSKLTVKQSALVDYLRQQSAPVSWAEA